MTIDDYIAILFGVTFVSIFLALFFFIKYCIARSKYLQRTDEYINLYSILAADKKGISEITKNEEDYI